MMKVTRKIKQTLSVLLAVAMMVTAVPQNALTVFAEETVEAVGETVSEGTEEIEVSEKDKEDTASSDEEKNTDSETEDVTEEKEKEENAETDEEEESEAEESETEEGEEPEEDELDDSESENKEIETELNTVTMSADLMSTDDNIASGKYGDITWVIDADGKLTVEGTGEIRENGWALWSSYSSSIKTAEINVTGVTSLKEMFRQCTNLESVDLRGLDTSQVEDMSGMFMLCSSLTTLSLNGINTSKVTNMKSMFNSCSNLTSLDLSSFDTGRVTDMSSMFSGCSKLTSVDLHGLDAREVTTMQYMFCGCNKLKSVNLSGLKTKQLKNMREMFNGCNKLTGVALSGLDTGQVTDMHRMFGDCSSLSSLDLSNINTSQVMDMSYMFFGCRGLTSLNMKGVNTSQVTNMYYMFAYCSELTSLDLSSFNTSQVTNMSCMFFECSGLTNLDLSMFNTGELIKISSMFDRCSGLVSLNMSSFDLSRTEQFYSLFPDYSGLSTIYAPYNLQWSIALPKEESTDIWYRSDGKTTMALPRGLSYSIVLTKNRKSVAADPYIKVAKTKTDYECGDTINLDDLTVTYYDKNGVATKLTEGYTTNVANIDMSTPGKKELVVTYQKLSAKVELTVSGLLQADKVTLTLPVDSCTYNGQERKPVPEVKLIGTGTKLTADKDYKVTYENNINVGTEAKVIITGQNGYSGSMEQTFTIKPAQVTITALDMFLQTNSEIPEQGDYKYRITGLCGDDSLLTEPTLTCAVSDMSKTGTYSIIPSGADAGSNYTIAYREGTLTVAEEWVVYTVSFDLRGHGTDIQPLTGIKAGSLIDEPAAPTAEGYTFGGWYKDKACTKAWSFATETIQEDVTLYACWTVGTVAEDDYSLRIQEIPDQIYSGSVLKPAVRVYAADGSTLLKAGKDYTIQYYNSTEADTEEEEIEGGISKTGEEGDNGFSKNLAYVVITGKGNYKDTVYRNFHILPASIGEGGDDVAAGITLKYTDQLTINAKKAQKPFSSLKYKKNMAAGKDFRITLTAVNVLATDGTELTTGQKVDADSTVPAIPAGYKGTFCMKIEGLGNYTGSIEKEIHVADKSYLIKNVSISLGKNQKKIAYREGEEITLAPGYYDAVTKKYYKAFEDGEVADIPEDNGNDLFTVKFGKTYLKYGKDYVIEYANNQAVGTATMTIIGKGDYSGSKSVNFTIAGTAFNTKNVVVGDDFQASKAYTGKPLTQNRVTLTTKSGESLTYGVHYTIRYKNNIKKGTATMQFVAKPESGYSGSFNKTFKITAPELKEVAQLKLIGAQEGDKLEGDDGIYTLQADIPYSREGAKPADRISLVSSETGAQLKEGTDYTVSYANNKAVTAEGTAANKMPVMTIKGKGNYAGTLRVIFSISEADFTGNDRLAVTAAPTAYIPGKKADYEYQPKIKVTDGKQTLKAKKDYTVEYQNCKQSEVNTYLEALVKGDKTAEELKEMRPKAVIKALAGSGYKAEEKTIDLDIYQKKMSTTCLYVVVSQEGTTYTGAQLKPEVTVYYGSSKAVSAAKKAKETDEEVLTGESATYQLMKLKPDTDGTGDYHVSYGSNVAAGKNKGTVTVTGTGLYGGSVTTKFDIISRDVYR